jgi:hypothetical protein
VRDASFKVNPSLLTDQFERGLDQSSLEIAVVIISRLLHHFVHPGDGLVLPINNVNGVHIKNEHHSHRSRKEYPDRLFAILNVPPA